MPRSFIGFAGADWWYHNRAHSDFQLLTRLAREHKVLIVNSVGMRMPSPGKTSRVFYKIWRKLKSVFKLLRRPVHELPNLYVFSPLPFPFYGTEFGRKAGAIVVRSQVSIVSFLIGIRSPTIIVTPPSVLPAVLPMQRSGLVYNRSDKHSLFKEGNTAYLEQVEEELMREADLTIYSNRSLMLEELDLTNHKSKHLDHGVDTVHFDYRTQTAEPIDMQGIPKPRIGFFGSLRSYMVNYDLIAKVAKEIPGVQVVLVGDMQDDSPELRNLPNVHLLGYKDYKLIPAYGVQFDVGLMPYQENDWIKYCNPIKLKEYLALGLEVVSVDFPEVRSFSDNIHIAGNADEFVELVKACIESPTSPAQKQLLRNRVENDTWDNRTVSLLEMIEEAAPSVRG